MKCLVFSDSHGCVRNMRRALSLNRDAEVVFFLGDGLTDLDEIWQDFPNVKFLAVRGNCDLRALSMGQMADKCSSIELLGKRIVYTHGDLYGAKYGTAGLERLAEERLADIVLFGHTHTPHTKYFSSGRKKPFYLFNPGSAGSRDGSFGILTLNEGQEPLFSNGNFL